MVLAKEKGHPTITGSKIHTYNPLLPAFRSPEAAIVD
jgi:hypothetical protein